MGMRDIPEVDFDEEIVVLLMAMYQDMGNHIALQYAGSHLVRTTTMPQAGCRQQARDWLRCSTFGRQSGY
jgi:hypothetical protein